ncbi:glutathione S-transferase [Mycena galericulata]|nr:glutathione S-transferase [Mycena galericulata]
MVLKLYAGTDALGGGAIVAMVLAEKQIPFEHIFVNLYTGDHKTPQFLEKHPFGQIPVLDDDGFILYESRAIARYLAEKYPDQGTSLVPTDLKQRAVMEQAASVEFANLNPKVLKVLHEKVIKPKMGQPVDEAALAEHISDLSAVLKVYDGILSKQKYLAGDELTLADVFHLSYGPLFSNVLDLMETTGPNTARWWKELTSRPAWINLTAEGIHSMGI